MTIFNNMFGGGNGGGLATWGDISGNLNNQTDLKNALDGKIDSDGSNAGFGNLNETAKQNITNTVFGNIQISDNSKVGYTIFYTGNQPISTFTLPSGGSYFVSTTSFTATAPYDFRSALSKNGIFAGGTTFTSGGVNLYVIGFAIKIQ